MKFPEEPIYTYDSSDRLASVKDARNNTASYAYNERGLMTIKTNPDNSTVSYTYDSFGNQSSNTNELGKTWTTVYDEFRRVTSSTDPLNHTMQISYALPGGGGCGSCVTQNKPTAITLPSGRITTITYDLEWQKTSQTVGATTAEAATTSYAYDLVGNKTIMTDPRGNSWLTAYDNRNRRITTSDPLLNEIKWTYDAAGNVLTQKDANQHIMTWAYDTLNRVAQVTNALNQVSTYAYDAEGNRIQETDGNGKIIYWRYDLLNRVLQQIRKEGDAANVADASDAVTTYTYDPEGNQITMTDANNLVTSYEYDVRNRRTKETNSANEATITSYDVASNISTVINPNGHSTSYIYDAANHLVQIQDSIGLIANSTYDADSNRLTQTDGNGNATILAYDALSRLYRISDALGQNTISEYDGASNLIKTTNREGKATVFAYDFANRRTQLTDALGNITAYQYDAVGNLTRLTDANLHAINYDYDALNRRIKETYPDPAPNTRLFTYDAAGNILTRSDQKGQVTTYSYNDFYYLLGRSTPGQGVDTFTYDVGGRMLSATRGDWTDTFTYDSANRISQAIQNGKVVNYTYDIPNRKKTIAYPGGRVISEQMDVRKRVGQITESGQPTPIAQYAYDVGDRVATRTYANGTISTYNYNANNWIMSLEHAVGATRVAGFGYDFDKEGNKLFEEKRHALNQSEAYSYDAIYRLTDYRVGLLDGTTVSAPTNHNSYDLDLVGNWNAKTSNGIVENRSHNSSNEIITINGAALTYDSNGNLQQDSNFIYTYDEYDRLIQATRRSDNTVVGQYVYDALGRRVIKRANATNPLIETRFYYDSDQIIEEQDSSGATLATYVYGNYLDEVLSMTSGNNTYYFHQNSLWSSAAVTDLNGNTVERYNYDPYGSVSITHNDGSPVPSNNWGTPHSAIGNGYCFTGRQLDEETGLYYYRARSYDPLKGRFLQRDPVGPEGGINLYSYVQDNPINAADPFGLKGVPSNCKQVRFTVEENLDIKTPFFDITYKLLNRNTVQTCDLPCDGCQPSRMGQQINTSNDIRIQGKFDIKKFAFTVPTPVGPIRVVPFGSGSGGGSFIQSLDTCTNKTSRSGCGFFLFQGGAEGCMGIPKVSEVCLLAQVTYSRRWCVDSSLNQGCLSFQGMLRGKFFWRTYDFVFIQSKPCNTTD